MEGDEPSWCGEMIKESLHNQVNYFVKTPFFNIPDLLEVNLNTVHPLVRTLFSREVPAVPLAGRLNFFEKNWRVLTQDNNILSIIKGYEIPFLEQPYQTRFPCVPHMNQNQVQLVDTEIKEMLKKGAIHQALPVQNQFLSTLLLVGKKNGAIDRS